MLWNYDVEGAWTVYGLIKNSGRWVHEVPSILDAVVRPLPRLPSDRRHVDLNDA
jgi:hypothetical protein